LVGGTFHKKAITAGLLPIFYLMLLKLLGNCKVVNILLILSLFFVYLDGNRGTLMAHQSRGFGKGKSHQTFESYARSR